MMLQIHSVNKADFWVIPKAYKTNHITGYSNYLVEIFETHLFNVSFGADPSSKNMWCAIFPLVYRIEVGVLFMAPKTGN